MANLLTSPGVAEKVAAPSPQLPNWKMMLHACQGILETLASIENLRPARSWEHWERELITMELIRVGKCAYVLADRFEKGGK